MNIQEMGKEVEVLVQELQPQKRNGLLVDWIHLVQGQHVIAKYRTTGLEAIFDSALKQALRADHSDVG
eukprot:11804759-Prorocentrum_lima.AAC.1